jgi:competence/damage-inducible protein CinA-like protein
MEVELLTIGNELLLGYTLDTNAAELARSLAEVGVRLVRSTTVGDDPVQIEVAVRDALTRTHFLVTTGGLGPTRDDMTKQVVADLFGVPLELDQKYLDRLRQRFERMGRGPMPERNRTQAEVPRGATILPNQWGTAPGLWISGDLGTVVMLPGVPQEMRNLAHSELIPRLQNETGAGTDVIRSRVVRTTGIAESALAGRLDDLEPRLSPLTLAYLPGLDGVDLRLTAWHVDAAEAGSSLDRGVALLEDELGMLAYGREEDDLAKVVLDLMESRGLRLGLAESCTGGLLGARVTAHPGSSLVFAGAVVSYSNAVKAGILGVSPETLEDKGAVSEETALEMVRGVVRVLDVECGLSITGIAGPDGGSEQKPVGTVCIGVKVSAHESTFKSIFPGDRESIRHRSAQAALNLLRRSLVGS